MSSVTLIQLISQQTMQNLLPVIALKPVRLVHLVTAKVASRSNHILEAARQAGINPRLELVHLSEMPSIAEVSGAVGKAILGTQADNTIPLVNFTGGTKLMSIGAYYGAMIGKATSLYVDTDHQHFVDGGSGPALTTFLGADLSFTSFQKQLRVDIVSAANGCRYLSSGRDFSGYEELSDFLLDHPKEETQCWEAVCGQNGFLTRGLEPRTAAEWLGLCDKPLHLPGPCGQLAVDAGLLVKTGKNLHLPCPHRRELESMAANFRPHPDYFRAISPIQMSLSFFTGVWWEVAVALAVRRSGRFRDVRWSVVAGEKEFGKNMEEDIVAMQGVQVAYFSCKRGGMRSKLLRLLEEVDASAKRLGGSFAKKYFCSYLPIPSSQKQNLVTRAGELGIKIIQPNDLHDPKCFG